MKLKTNIARLLAAGLLLNNIYFYSNANTLDDEILGRYETLEGEYIAIDDSAEGELHEIEIFGNTVQDENNLEDIQSVGDLYVDESGNPILDKQGREQYTVNILSSNYRRLYSNQEIVDIYNNMGYSNVKAELTPDGKFKCINNGGWQNPNKVFKGKPNTEYTFSFVTRPEWLYTNGLTLIDNYSDSVKTYRTDSTGEFGFLVSPDIGTTFDFKIYEGNIPNIEEFIEEESKTTILLPQPLFSLNSKYGSHKKLSDKLFWSDELGKYIIKKNISMIHIEKFTNKYGTFFQYPVIDNPDNIDLGLLYWYEYTPFVEKMEYAGWGGTPKNSNYGLGVYSSGGIRCYQKADVDFTLDELNDYIGVSGIKMYTQLYESQIIETNITSKLKIPTYDEKTYIYVDSNNGINPTLKVTVDRLPQIAKNAIEEAENDSTSYNISLARMYINMLPESLYKDQLQEQLSEVFSSDITLDRKSASSNLDVYVKSQNMLSLSLDTNNVSFEDYSGIAPIEKLNAVNITINSSLPYDLNAYIPVEISNADGSNKIDLDILNIRESGETTYQTFENTTDKIVLKSDCAKGNGNIHNIDLKLDSNVAHKADVYKTVIKFEAEQK